MRRLALVATLAASGSALLAACGGGGEAEPASSRQAATPTVETATTAEGADSREGGFEVALGEWAVTPEAEAIRPGRATFVIVNRGTMPHGFEIEREDVEDDASKVETRLIEPGESVEVELDLEAGVYKLECNVEDHDDMGMEMLLEVSPDAPFTAEAAPATATGTAVAIEAFAFSPATVTVQAGQPVTWENHDPADHTITAEDGSFDSGALARGIGFETTFDTPGEHRYLCALHPGMKGTVIVER